VRRNWSQISRPASWIKESCMRQPQVSQKLDHDSRQKSSFRFWFPVICVVLAATTLVFLTSFPGAQAKDDEKLAATWSRGTLHLTIPYDGLQVRPGQLT